MARQQPQPSPFEPGQVRGSDARAPAADISAPKALGEPKSPPRAILLDEPIGWSENGVLCTFRERQLVTNPFDIKRLIQRGAQYMVVTPS